MLLHIILLVLGIVALFFGAEWLVKGAARLSASFGVSPIVVGLTVVSLGTSAPELVVCVVAAIRGNGELAVGNVLGSNLANVGLILGATALVQPLRVAARVVSREAPIMVLITLLLFPVLADQEVSRAEGFILLIILFAYLSFVFRSAKEEPAEVFGEYEQFTTEQYVGSGGKERPRSSVRDGVLIALGGIGLVLGGYLIVKGASFLALSLGIPELIVGLSVVAVGTSLPELATSLVAALRGEADIAVGNAIGSNIFNITAILGTAAIVRPLQIGGGVMGLELPAVVLLSLLLIPVVRTAYTIRRLEGGLLLGAYLVLGVFVFGVV